MMEKIASEFRFDSLVYPNNIKETVTWNVSEVSFLLTDTLQTVFFRTRSVKKYKFQIFKPLI